MNTPTVWIVGGVDKGNDYNELMALVREKVKAIICLGKDNKRIHEAFEDDVEINEGPQVESWAGGQENYTFQTDGDTTNIIVEVDVTEDHATWFDKTYPLALAKLKEVIEKS